MKWAPNEPTGEGNPCGQIKQAQAQHQVEGFFWFDFDCDSSGRFICKRTTQSKLTQKT